LGSLCCLALALGIIRTEVASWQFDVSPLESSLGKKVEITGVVVTEPSFSERTVQLYIQTETDKILVSTDRHAAVQYGDEVTVSGKLERPEVFVTDLGRTFDYVNYLRVRGVEYRISLATVKLIASDKGNFLLTNLLKFKQSFIVSFQQVIPEPAAGLGSGLLLGVKSALGTDIESDFRRTGIIHIVVLSGYNVMLVVAFIMFCLSFFLPLRARIWFGIVSIIAFAAIVGFSATVVRASFMAVLVLVSQVLGRRYEVLRGLLLAGVIMILFNPYLLVYDIGFQLSFMATLGLILIVPMLEVNAITGKGLFGWKEFLLSTIATQIAVLPLLMYHIGEISLISIVVNVLVLPMVPPAMLLTFLTGLLGFFSVPLANLVGYAATLSLQYILLVAHYFATLPFATVTVPAFSAAVMLLLYLGMTIVWCWWNNRSKEDDYLAGWLIEEEGEAVVTKEKRVGELPSNSPTPKDELPIFFR
jgi:competence protein ComEC